MQKSSSMPDAIKASFQEMLMAEAYEKITISDLCKKSGVSRKSFYTHFKDKTDVVGSIFYDDIAKPIRSLSGLFGDKDIEIGGLLMVERVYIGVYENKEFYQRLATPNRSQVLSHVIIKTLMAFHDELFLQTEDKDPEYWYASTFTSFAQAGILLKWIREGFQVPTRELAQWYYDWALQASVTLSNREKIDPQRIVSSLFG